MPNLAKYLVWLKWLTTLAANAPAFIAAAKQFYDAVKGFLPKLPEAPATTPDEGGLQLTQAMTAPDADAALVAEVAEAEEKVLALCDTGAKGTLAVRDGSRLRELFAFFLMLKDLLAGLGIGG